MLQSHKMTGSGRNRPIIISKHQLCPKAFLKFFFVFQTQKFMKLSKKSYRPPPPPKKIEIFGGVKLLNVVFIKYQ